MCRRVAAALLSKRHRWRDRVRGSRFVRHYGAVFEGFVDGRQWFVLVDLGVEAVCGVLAALVDLPQQQGSGCAALKIVMVAVTAAYAAAVAALRPSNTPMDAVAVSSNAAMGAAVAVAVLLLGPGVGAQLVFAQGIVAVATAVLPLVVFVLSRRAQRRVLALLRYGARHQVPSDGLSCDSDSGVSLMDLPAAMPDDGGGDLMLCLGETGSTEPTDQQEDAEEMLLHSESSISVLDGN